MGTFRCVLQYADATVEGVVVDIDGMPISGASVIASGGNNQDASAFSDGDGRFLFRGLEPGIVVFKASRTGFGPSAPSEVELRAGQTEGPVVLELHPQAGANIVLRVSTVGGSVSGAPVYLVGAETSRVTPIVELTLLPPAATASTPTHASRWTAVG